MNVAVIGKSQINAALTEQLMREGLMPVLLEDIDDIRGFEGEKGLFVIKTNRKRIQAGYVILTQQAEWVNIEGCPKISPEMNCSLYSLLDIVEQGIADDIDDFGKPIVIVLDFPVESAGIMTRIALEKGLELALKKKRVFFLARFIRTAGNKLEKLYKESRNAGVTFIKYNKFSFDRRDDDVTCTVRVSDDYGTISIDTAALIMGDRIIAGAKIYKIAKIMGLKQDKSGFIGGDNPWLYPSLTNRKGIYVINNICGMPLKDDALSQIAYTISAIKKELNEPANGIYAEVDPGKCAFCYTCWRICPHAAMIPDFEAEEAVMKNLNEACSACGICVSLCPAAAISIKGGLGDKLKEKDSSSNTLKILCCENSAHIALQKIKDKQLISFEKIDLSTISCGGEINASQIISLLKQYQKVLVAVCIDDACKHFDGNKRAYRQLLRARELLNAAGLDQNRLQYIEVSHAMPRLMADSITEIL